MEKMLLYHDGETSTILILEAEGEGVSELLGQCGSNADNWPSYMDFDFMKQGHGMAIWEGEIAVRSNAIVAGKVRELNEEEWCKLRENLPVIH